MTKSGDQSRFVGSREVSLHFLRISLYAGLCDLIGASNLTRGCFDKRDRDPSLLVRLACLWGIYTERDSVGRPSLLPKSECSRDQIWVGWPTRWSDLAMCERLAVKLILDLVDARQNLPQSVCKEEHPCSCSEPLPRNIGYIWPRPCTEDIQELCISKYWYRCRTTVGRCDNGGVGTSLCSEARLCEKSKLIEGWRASR